MEELQPAITVDFETSNKPPEVMEVVAENPWVIRVYFNEDVTSTTAQDKNNYTITGTSWAGQIGKVCWYGIV